MRLVSAAAFVAALLPAGWMWGFTVDDAWIAIRYARHLSRGLGWCFNAGGPPSDGVTPLPWPLVLAVFARGTPATTMAAATLVSLAVWLAAAVRLGAAMGRSAAPGWRIAGALAATALAVPVAAHAVSGMETGVAMGLATFAAIAVDRPRRAAVIAGLAALLRPELAPWALALAVGAAWARGAGRRETLAASALALVPFVLAALVRLAAFGRPAPLALLAKPSDVEHGLAYAGAAAVACLTPLLLVAPVSLARAARDGPSARAGVALVAAAGAHFATIVIVGGDWMPYARLAAPVVPSLAYAFVLVPSARAGMARALVATIVGAVLLVTTSPAGRGVRSARARLVSDARPFLEGARRVAALDVGWVSAATEADVVDLAGLTDPEIAALPGGHTSKRVDAAFLLARDPDVLFLYLPRGLPDGGLDAWREARFERVVEARLAASDLVARHFVATGFVVLGGGGYVVLSAIRDDPR